MSVMLAYTALLFRNWVIIPSKAWFFFLQVFLKRKADVKDEMTFVIER